MLLAAALSCLGYLVCRGVDDIVLPSISEWPFAEVAWSVLFDNGVTKNLVGR